MRSHRRFIWRYLSRYRKQFELHFCIPPFFVLTLLEIDGLKSLLAECYEDKDMLNMATEEMDQAIEEERRLQNLLLKSLLPKDDADERDCILEPLVGRRLPCLRWTSLKCMRSMLTIKAGSLNSSI